MNVSQSPIVTCLAIEATLVDALAEIDELSLEVSGARLQHALDTFRSEWVEAFGVSKKTRKQI